MGQVISNFAQIAAMPGRNNLALTNQLSCADISVALGGDNSKKALFTGAGNFFARIGDGNGNAAYVGNGYISIKGNITDPNVAWDADIAGHTSYMCGVESDVGANPTFLCRGGGGPLYTGYSNGGVKTFEVGDDGSVMFGVAGSATHWVGANVAGQAAAQTTSGQWRSYFGGEANPRVHINNNGSIAFSLDGTVALGVNGCRVSIPAAGQMALSTSNFTGLIEAVRIDNNQRVGIGTIPDYQLDVTGAIGFSPGASVTPVANGDVVFEFTSNTTFTIRAKGSDGTVRSVALTLA